MFSELLNLLMSIFLIAVSAIGIECYNGNKSWENNTMRKNSKNFMISMIVLGIFGIIGSAFLLYTSARA